MMDKRLHHEFYLSDAGKVAPEKQKIVAIIIFSVYNDFWLCRRRVVADVNSRLER